MRNGFLFILVSGALNLLVPYAHAQETPVGVVLFPSFSAREQSGVLSGDLTAFNLDLRAGYRIASGFYFGMIFSETTSGGSSSINEFDIGNSVGYFSGAFSLITSFYLYGQAGENSPTASITRSEGLGLQIDMSLLFPIGSGFNLGPVFTYKNMTYRKLADVTGNTTSKLQPQSSFYPFIGVLFTF